MPFIQTVESASENKSKAGSSSTPGFFYTCIMKSLVSIVNLLSNKYLLTGVLFIVWISFFDDRDLITNYKQRQELWKLEQSKKHYSQLVEETKIELHKIQTEPAQLEKFAREKFRMKKDNEDLYIIPE